MPKKQSKSLYPDVPSDAYEFDVKDIIFCYHGPTLYKAKVLQRSIQSNDGAEEATYYVHYHGWNKQWDEWVAASRCLPHTPQNIDLQKQTAKQQKQIEEEQAANATKNNLKTEKKAKKKKRKRQIEDSEDDTDTDPNAALQSQYHQRRQLKKDDLDDLRLNRRIKVHEAKHKKPKHDTHTHGHAKPESNAKNEESRRRFKERLKTIIIPTALRINLVEQYELIHKHQKLIKLPKQDGFTVNDILKETVEAERVKLREKQTSAGASEDIKAQETVTQLLPYVTNGIKGYFRNTLERNLLYNFEKIQYEEIAAANKGDVCSVYGAEHLVRLFYILPNILFHTHGVNNTNFGQIKQCMSVIIQFLNKNKAKYLIDYGDSNRLGEFVESVNEEYITKSKEKAQKYYNEESKPMR